MVILISGATGFVGRSLCQVLKSKGHEILVISRTPDTAQQRIGVDVTARARAEDFLDTSIDAIINLAGAPIFDKRWSESRKKTLIDSRVEITRSLVTLCKQLKQPPRVMISGSAMGFYGNQGDRDVDEHTYPRKEFAHQLCAEWEQAAQGAASTHTRLVIVRTGLVLDPSGGMLKGLLPVAKLGLSAQLGSGRQYMPWITLEDAVRALVWMLETPSAKGIYNLSAPHPVTNAELTHSLAKAVHRPVLFRAPGILLKGVLGERANMLLTGARMRPHHLQQSGFSFHFPSLPQALQHLLKT